MKLYKLLYVLPFLFTSCDLEKQPYGLSALWTTEASAQMGLDSAYEPFYNEEGYGRGQYWAGPASDDMVVNRNKPEVTSLTNFISNVNSVGGMYDNWKLLYQVIRRSNDVLRNVPSIKMTESSKDVMLGEANFLCAYSYFFLAKRYGGVPFYDINNPNVTNRPRETKENTYIKIEGYLKEAIKHFEAQQLWKRSDKDWGRPNLGAAYGLLAKVYAHWGKFQNCKDACEKVIGKYSLDVADGNGFNHLFSIDGEKHEEVLFNLTNQPTRNNGTITSTVLMSAKFTEGKGWYYFAPTKSLRNAYAEGDQRRMVTVVGDGDKVSYIGKEFVLSSDPVNGNIRDMGTGYMCVKYSNAYKKVSSWQWESGADIPLLRYSDILLLHAESIMMLNGGGPDIAKRNVGIAAAATSFNLVHVRAFGNDATKAIAAPTFMDLVNERRCELAYEDERHYDLVRWGLAKEVYGAATIANDPRGPRSFDPIKDAHFPLPQKEIDNSNGLLINNPLSGYSSFNK